MLQGSFKDKEQFMWLGDVNRDNHQQTRSKLMLADCIVITKMHPAVWIKLMQLILFQCTPKYLPNMRSYFPLKK